jgi:hypothetical protein
VSRDGDRVAAISTAGTDGAFIEAVFGGFPTDGWLADMQTAYNDAFRPTKVTADAAGLVKIIREGFRFPLFFTRGGLKRDFGGFGRDEPTLFIVDPDSPLDLIDFWNSRLCCRSAPVGFGTAATFWPNFSKTITDRCREIPTA